MKEMVKHLNRAAWSDGNDGSQADAGSASFSCRHGYRTWRWRIGPFVRDSASSPSFPRAYAQPWRASAQRLWPTPWPDTRWTTAPCVVESEA